MSIRGHALPHRYGNYIWPGPGTQVEYAESPPGEVWPARFFGSRSYVLERPWRARVARMWREYRRGDTW